MVQSLPDGGQVVQAALHARAGFGAPLSFPVIEISGVRCRARSRKTCVAMWYSRPRTAFEALFSWLAA